MVVKDVLVILEFVLLICSCLVGSQCMQHNRNRLAEKLQIAISIALIANAIFIILCKYL